MSQYGKTAVAAALVAQRGKIKPPEAWKLETEKIFTGKSSQSKSCPRNAFLGLCEEGYVKKIPSGKYTNSNLNKSYATCAIKLLYENESLKENVDCLWRRVMCEVRADLKKVHNDQMDVVIALWNNNLIDLSHQKK